MYMKICDLRRERKSELPVQLFLSLLWAHSRDRQPPLICHVFVKQEKELICTNIYPRIYGIMREGRIKAIEGLVGFYIKSRRPTSAHHMTPHVCSVCALYFIRFIYIFIHSNA